MPFLQSPLRRWTEQKFHDIHPLDRQRCHVITVFCFLAFWVLAFSLVLRFVGTISQGNVAYKLATIGSMLSLTVIPAVLARFRHTPSVICVAAFAVVLTAAFQKCNVSLSLEPDDPLSSPTYAQMLVFELLLSLVLGGPMVFRLTIILRALNTISFAIIFPKTNTQVVFVDIMTVITAYLVGMQMLQMWDMRRLFEKQRLETNSYLMSLLLHETRTPMQCILASVYELQEDPPQERRHAITHTLTQQVHKMSGIQTIIDEYEHIDSGSVSIVEKPYPISHKLSTLLEKAAANRKTIQITHTCDIGAEVVTTLDWVHVRYAICILLDGLCRGVQGGMIHITPRIARGKNLLVTFHCTGSERVPLKTSRCFNEVASTMFRHDATMHSLNYIGHVDASLLLARRVLERLEAMYGYSFTTAGDEVESIFVFMQIPIKDIHGQRSSSQEDSISLSRIVVEPRDPQAQDIALESRTSEFESKTPSDDDGRVVVSTSTRHIAAKEDSVSDTRRGYILVVDDNSMIRTVMTTLLRSMGFTCIAACDGVEAIEKVNHAAPILVIMDLQMPRMSGIAATMALRKMGLGMPVLALSAGGLKSDIEECRRSGFNGYYSKPINADALQQAVTFHLHSSEWRSATHNGDCFD